MDRQTIELDQGWVCMQKGITKLKKALEEQQEQPFSPAEFMEYHTTIYNMCTQKPPHDYSQQLYDKYQEAFQEYIASTVLPSLIEKHDEFMLRELVKRWLNHKKMVRWLSRFFHYLDRYFIARRSLPALNEVGLTCFRDQVYNEIKDKVRDAVIILIDKEREGEQIDRALLKNVLHIFVEIGMGNMERYEKDFEEPMLDDTGGYYSRKATSWISEDSCPDYMLKSEECLRKERERVSHYLHSSSEPKLVEKVQNELLVVKANKLLEKGISACRALLRDGKVDDLSRMYRLYHKIPTGLELIANTFKQHVTEESTDLVQQAEDAASNQATTSSGGPGQVLIRKIIELNDKYRAYVTDCFSDNTLFHKALKEAYEVFCNKTVAGSSSAELLATFCDNTLKKGGSEKLGDKATVETLEKVVKLLAYISDKDPFAEFYWKELAWRLLFYHSANDDHERHILTKLEQQCGTHFTSKKEGMATTSSGASEQVLIRKIIELHATFMAYVTGCFSNNTLFHKALKEAYEVFCNKTVAGGSSAELLATCCNNILKKDRSGESGDEAIEETLEKVVNLLPYVSDKDLFAEFYRKKLARRLLFDHSANDDHERSILTKLKQQCGEQFTSKMERMVTDLTLARENQTGFEGYLSSNPAAHPGLDLTVTVLTTGFWPSYKSFDLNLPAEMVRCVEVFKGYYETKTKHRKLTWIHSLGTCHVNGKFEQKTIELVVSTYQAAVLLLFNSSDRLSYSEIMAQLNLTDDDLVRLLHSLSCAKYKILTKEPNTRTISQTDSFEFNSKFTDRMRRIKIPLPPVDERKKVVQDVDKDQRYAIEAALVRIMKSRKVLGHQQLVSECVEQLSRMFKPDIKAIKKRMEDLIFRDYLERDKENPNLFRYLA